MGSDEDLLEAALTQFALTGVRRTSADDIARRAGVNRATLYRRLGSREDMVRAAARQEAARVIGQLLVTIGPVPEPTSEPDFDPVENVVEFFTLTIRAVRGNRVMKQWLELDREQALVALTAGATETLRTSAAVCADRIRALRRHLSPEPPDGDIDAVALTMARLVQSLLLTPDGAPALRTTAQLRRYAEQVIVPLVLPGVRVG